MFNIERSLVQHKIKCFCIHDLNAKIVGYLLFM